MDGNVLNVTGIFRSGTNLFRTLMETGYDCRITYDIYGWKHAPFPLVSRSDEMRYPERPNVFLTKNPYSLLSSLYAYAWKPTPHFKTMGEQNMSSFLTSSVVLRPLTGKSPELYFDNPIAMINTYYWNYVSTVAFKPKRFMLVTYEDLISDPETVTAAVAQHFNLKKRAAEVALPSEKTRNMRSQQKNENRYVGNEEFDLERVVNHDYMSEFSAADKALVAAGFNSETARALGYGDLMETLSR